MNLNKIILTYTFKSERKFQIDLVVVFEIYYIRECILELTFEIGKY